LRQERNWQTNLTTLSGEIGVAGNTDNSYHVVTGATGATLDGFMITAGNANSLPDNLYGGGMYNNASSPKLYNVTFYANSTTYDGGGMYNTLSNPTLENVTFSSNTAVNGRGGGIFNGGSNPTLTNVTFSSNSATTGGGMVNVSSSPSLTNVTFSSNSATTGGGMYNEGGSNPTLTNVTSSGNTATSGGGMYNDAGFLVIKDSIFWGDSTEFANTGNLLIYDSLIQGGCPALANCNVNIRTTDPMLGALADNGGYTLTMALGSGSPAIDAGNNLTCAAADQRGYARPADGDGNGTAVCDMGAYEYLANPTAVDLLSFTAQVEKKPAAENGKSVILGWRTTSEVNNLGFNLYRAASVDGARIKLNSALIPSLVPPGSPFGAVYTYKDTGLKKNTAYYYWLEVVDIHGRTSLTGPVLVKLVTGKTR